MDRYFEIRTSFLDKYFLNEPVPWTGRFLNYWFFGQVKKKFLVKSAIWTGDGKKLGEKSALDAISPEIIFETISHLGSFCATGRR